MRTLRYMMLLLPLLAATSCAELFTYVEAESSDQPRDVTMPYHTLFMQVGESLSLQADVLPESENIYTYWTQREMGDDSPIDQLGSLIVARKLGSTRVYVQAIKKEDGPESSITPRVVADSCTVHVIDPRYPDYMRYPYDMVLYARIFVDGEELAAPYQVYALMNGEVHGMGERLEDYGMSYYAIRVFSLQPTGGIVSLQCYNPLTHDCITLDQRLSFDIESHGTLHQLLRLTGGRNN